MYTCNNPVCDPCCDFCWFCEHDKYGVSTRCKHNNTDDFSDGIEYCDGFKCRLHEDEPTMPDQPLLGGEA